VSEELGLRLLAVGLVAAALAGSACGPRADAKPQAPAKQSVLWRPLGSWSGRGSLQTGLGIVTPAEFGKARAREHRVIHER